jgi:hypothetical protein
MRPFYRQHLTAAFCRQRAYLPTVGLIKVMNEHEEFINYGTRSSKIAIECSANVAIRNAGVKTV